MDDRSLTAGCSGCARRRELLAAWWAGIDPTKAINLHSTRSVTEHRGAADLIGAGLEPSVEGMALIRIADLDVPLNPPQPDEWAISLFVDGDITSRYPLAASNYTAFIGPFNSEDAAQIAFLPGDLQRSAACGDNLVGGYTRITFGVFFTGPSTGGSPGSTMTVTIREGDTVIDHWPSVPLCDIETPGSPDSDVYVYRDPDV